VLQHAATWDFLHRISELANKKEQLTKHCSDLQLVLAVGSDAMSKELLYVMN
jgi:hypothetical protein